LVGSCEVEIVIWVIFPLRGRRRVVTFIAPFGPYKQVNCKSGAREFRLPISARVARDSHSKAV
jgi:hypothetical protein